MTQRFCLLIIHIEVDSQRSPIATGQVIFRTVDRNAVKPRVELTVATELGELPPCLDESFLRHIQNFFRVADEAADELVNAMLIARKQ